LLVLLIPMVAAGCGGGSTETATKVETRHTEQPLSKAGYIALADTICRNHQSRREDLESQANDLGRLNSEREAHQVADLLRQQSENLMAEAQELQALQAPSADIRTRGSMSSFVRTQASVIDNWAKAYDDLDAGEIRRLQIRLGVTISKSEKRAQAYGFKVCGQE